MSLTPKQKAVHDWVMQGLTNKQIAQRLKIAESTVKLHMTSILRVYGVQNRLQLIAYSKQGVANNIVTVDVEETPFAWIQISGNAIKGLVCGAKSPCEGWQPVYFRKAK